MTKAHTARHLLPISNGYGSGPGGVSVYCGRCDDSFLPNAGWAVRYFAARRRRIESDVLMWPGARADALADIVRQESLMLARMVPPSVA